MQLLFNSFTHRIANWSCNRSSLIAVASWRMTHIDSIKDRILSKINSLSATSRISVIKMIISVALTCVCGHNFTPTMQWFVHLVASRRSGTTKCETSLVICWRKWATTWPLSHCCSHSLAKSFEPGARRLRMKHARTSLPLDSGLGGRTRSSTSEFFMQTPLPTEPGLSRRQVGITNILSGWSRKERIVNVDRGSSDHLSSRHPALSVRCVTASGSAWQEKSATCTKPTILRPWPTYGGGFRLHYWGVRWCAFEAPGPAAIRPPLSSSGKWPWPKVAWKTVEGKHLQNIKGEVRAICRFWVFDGNGLLGHRLIFFVRFPKVQHTETENYHHEQRCSVYENKNGSNLQNTSGPHFISSSSNCLGKDRCIFCKIPFFFREEVAVYMPGLGVLWSIWARLIFLTLVLTKTAIDVATAQTICLRTACVASKTLSVGTAGTLAGDLKVLEKWMFWTKAAYKIQWVVGTDWISWKRLLQQHAKSVWKIKRLIERVRERSRKKEAEKGLAGQRKK